jgi:hypothetical protein
MKMPRYPSLYQINTRVLLTDLAHTLARPATLDDISDEFLGDVAQKGFDWIWLLSVWQTGTASQRVSRADPNWRKEFQETLPDLGEEDIAGSGFAITSYTVSTALGGPAALERLRKRLDKFGIRLMLDFVPNHMALDHPWIDECPDHFIKGTPVDLAANPGNFTRVSSKHGDLILAHGRDPYFPGWSDTLQINYGRPETQEAMIGELVKIASQCDGVRCDMAMLVLPEVFARTWQLQSQPFWPKAIQQVRQQWADFRFMAEVYWDLEWTLQQQGFDYTYDKRLYDRLRSGYVRPIREHLAAGLDFQDKLVRFLENHDEPRAASVFPPDIHEAAALITFLSPGMRFFHQGQFEGCKKRISPHLVRAPKAPVDSRIQRFYDRLLALLRRSILRDGQWQLLPCRPAWESNGSWDSFLAFAWQGAGNERLVMAVNFSSHNSQCYVQLPYVGLRGSQWIFQDQMDDAVYQRHGDDLAARGLYLDVAPWRYHVFTISEAP